MDKKKLRSADILTSIIFIIISLYILIFSINLMLKNPDRRFYISAGFTPLLLSIFFILVSLNIMYNGIKDGGTLSVFSANNIISGIKSKTGLNIIFILFWIGFYIFILLNVFPYIISTFVFLIGFFIKYHKGSIIFDSLLALFISIAVTYVFGSIVNIPLP